MKLFTTTIAPNPTKVALYLSERATSGCPIELEQVVVSLQESEQRSSAHLGRNPFGTLPVLELDDGSHLIESLSIIDYFEAKLPDGCLLPENVQARALARDMERIVEFRLGFPLLDFIHATNSPFGLAPNPGNAAKALEQLAASLDFLERTLSDGRPYLTGEKVSTADISLAAYLFFARIIGQDVLGERANLRAWRRRYTSRPAAKRVFDLSHA